MVVVFFSYRWCAYEVDDNGVAVDGKWADCTDACPNDGEDCKSLNVNSIMLRCF